MRPFDDRRILLVVTGGIAAYKSVALVRRLRERGCSVDVLMTESAEKMVGAATFEALSGRPVHRNLWERPLAHIELGRDADLAVVAPATANTLARMAGGYADDMATSTLLAADCPVVVCPAMNTRMWTNPATVQNVETLRGRGVAFVGPEEGRLAEAEEGMGRMAEPATILAELGRLLEPPGMLTDLKVVVTAGPTREPVDPVRFVGNRSSGRMGFALAESAWRRGASVTVVAGPTTAEPPHGPHLIRVEKSSEMLEVLQTELDGAAVLLMAAAVSDFGPEQELSSKIKKENTGDTMSLELRRGPDLLSETLDQRRAKGVFTLGFALETSDGLENARRKLESKGIDLVALNDAGDPESGFDSPTNRVTIIDPDGAVEELPLLAKEEVADRLLDRIEAQLSGAH
ncbi:MAG: bifunctional phosphopantothenoylcysteine decarboxylase/phosphopantothenate--cysteine ligase CoaBC [Gemmatimonadota bacterium]